MSKQQSFLLVLSAVLCVSAIPGLLMAPPPSADTVDTDRESAVSEGSGSSTNSSQVTESPSSVPETTLQLEKASEAQREEIRFSRKININEADAEELQKIPSVGPATAEKIVQFRNEGNVFYRVEDMDKIGGIGRRTIDDLRPHITVGKEYLSQQSDNESTDDKVDLNTADQSELQTLPGVGSTTAQRIIQYREQYGGFSQPSDIKNISGIGGVTYEKLSDKIRTSPVSEVRSSDNGSFSSGGSSSSGDKVNINTASKSELETLTGVGSVTAERIIQHRDEHGDFGSVDDLDNVKGIGSATVDKIRSQATTY